MKPSGGTGNSSVARSAFAGITPAISLPTREKSRPGRLSQKLVARQAFLPMQKEPEKKISEGKRVRPQVSWPRALRAVRAWLEPWIMLRRYWSGWSLLPPPPAVQLLLRWLEKGQAIALYSSA